MNRELRISSSTRGIIQNPAKGLAVYPQWFRPPRQRGALRHATRTSGRQMLLGV